MEQLLQAINEYFAKKEAHFAVFSLYDVRIESWLKGELIVLFFLLQQQQKIKDFYPEHLLPTGRRVDFKIITADNETAFLELKAFCISRLKTNRGLTFYFSDDHLYKDFRKLNDANCPNKYAMAFVYPSPAKESWAAVTNNMQLHFGNWSSCTELAGTEDSYFIAAWKWS